jgi:hypothetical protein
MRTFWIITLATVASLQTTAQSWELGSDFNLAQPVGGMTRSMNNAFGMSFNISRNLKSPFSLGAEMGFGSYGSETSRQAYTFDDGTVTETDVVVNNNIFNLQLTGKYFIRNNKKVNPYLSGKLGWTWYSTNLVIEDPEDEFSCHPIESDILFRDNTYTASAGAGVKIDFNAVFRKMESQRFFIDASIHSVSGGTVRYMNSEKDPAQAMPDQDITAKFLNTQTEVIHEHHVGYVYTSLISMVEYRLGVSFRPGWK